MYYTAYADFTTPHPTRRKDYALEDGLDRILTPALVPKETSDLALGKCRCTGDREGGIDRLVGVSGLYRSMNDSTSWPYPLEPGRSTVNRANEDRRRGSGVP
jgi:hypothetical protein